MLNIKDLISFCKEFLFEKKLERVEENIYSNLCELSE